MPPAQLTIPATVARRFVLGRQGLWPGRRWSGPAGTAEAMRAVEHLQLDTLNITARSQDLMLHARVRDYQIEGWETPTYAERAFFDWGSWLAVRPMEELPYFRRYMLEASNSPQQREWAQAHAGLLREMRAALREQGPLSNRDFSAESRRRVNHYRARKDSALALYHLWRTGEAMISGRSRFERQYDLTERVAPPELIREETLVEAEQHMMLKSVAFYGLRGDFGNHPLTGAQKAREAREVLKGLKEQELLVHVAVEGERRPHYLLRSDLPLLEALMLGRVPSEWRHVGTSTLEAVRFLSPLDPVVARGRAGKLFSFDYVWEVYKPQAKRKWGYYVLPILWGDELVARADMRLVRENGTLEILSFQLEDERTANDTSFAEALARGLAEFNEFLGGTRVSAAAIKPAALRRAAVNR